MAGRRAAQLVRALRYAIPAVDFSLLPSALSPLGASLTASAPPLQHARQLCTSTASSCNSQLDEQRRGAYKVQVAVKAYEQRYLRAASAVIRDLMFINFAPKSSQLLPEQPRTTKPLPLNLFMPLEQQVVPLKWAKSRFTLIRGPHIDKTGMEQFETRKYKATMTAYTHDPEELDWFLDSLRFYQFPGVQLQLILTSSTFLAPPQLAPLPPPQAPHPMPTSLLHQHRQHIAAHLVPTAAEGPQAAGSSAAAQQLSASLHSLRQALHAGLLAQRTALADSPAYQDWHRRSRLRSPSATAPGPPDLLSTSGVHPDALMNPMTQLPGHTDTSPTAHRQAHIEPSSSTVGGPGMAVGAGGGLMGNGMWEGGVGGGLPGRRGGTGEDPATAFVRAADAALLSLDLAALEGHRNFPFHFATFQVGQEEPAQEWMPAMLRAGQVAAALEAAAQERSLTQAYASFALFAHALLFALFKQWVQAGAAEVSPHLALPSQQEMQSWGSQGRG